MELVALLMFSHNTISVYINMYVRSSPQAFPPERPGNEARFLFACTLLPGVLYNDMT